MLVFTNVMAEREGRQRSPREGGATGAQAAGPDGAPASRQDSGRTIRQHSGHDLSHDGVPGGGEASGADLLPRKRPVQKRSRETVERILDATSTLLDETGVETLTTNVIADRAGVKVASLYQYFPNKYAVLTALATRITERQVAFLDDFDADAAAGISVDDLVSAMVDAFASASRAQLGLRSMIHAMRAVPELQQIYVRSNAVAADKILVLLEDRGVKAGKKRLRAVAMTIVESCNAMLDLSMAGTEVSERMAMEELKKLLQAYVALYI